MRSTLNAYIPAAEAFRKLQFAEGKPAAVYIYGATGFGKSRLVREYLKGKQVLWLSPHDEDGDPSRLIDLQTGNEMTCVVIDDLQQLSAEVQQKLLLPLIGRENLWLIMIGRIAAPYWLIPKIAGGQVVIISEEDLQLSKKEVSEIALAAQVTLDDEALARVASGSKGNAYIISAIINLLQAGHPFDDSLIDSIRKAFIAHLEMNIIPQWDVNLQEFLMQLSVVEEFTLPLAFMITGDDQAAAMIEKALSVGNFLQQDNDTYRLRPELLSALRSCAMKKLGLQKYRQCQNNAALHYELHRNYPMALALYQATENTQSIRSLLIRHAREHMGSGDYYSLRQYYLQLSEEDVENSPILMSALSMLHSVMMNPAESERWYDKIKQYAATVRGGERREATQQLLYLNIALPHRGSIDLIEVIRKTVSLLPDGGLELPEFSLTNNQPSTMNGGKDFCSWSKHDQLVANTIGGIVEKLLGSFGKGIVHAALCESFYEKGGRDEESMQHAIMVQMAADSGGKTELLFAAVGIQVRYSLLTGNRQYAQRLLDSFEERVRREQKPALLQTIAALRCRIALVTGDMEAAKQWMTEAPDEHMEFWTLERYRYLTKVRCYLAFGQNVSAIELLERLLYYAEVSQRTYIRMESKLLLAIALRREKREWKATLLEALTEIREYAFVRIISEKGAGILPLLKEVRAEYLATETADSPWYARVLKETKDIAGRYPTYLSCDAVQVRDFSDTAMTVLRMQAAGLSIREIAEKLNMSERAIKYHASENYHKLGAKGKTDAVQIARNLNLL